MINEDEIRRIIRATLKEERETSEEIIAQAVQRALPAALPAALSSLGIFSVNEREREALKADFSHLRRWRLSVEQAQTMTMRTVIGVIVTGFAGAVWLGVKTFLALKSGQSPQP